MVGDNLLVQDLIDFGMYQEVGLFFDKYVLDIWKKVMEQDLNVWNQYSCDGKRMGILVFDYVYNNDYLFWICQDWLDKLNMKVLKMIDELEVVMEVFKNNNLDGLVLDKVILLSIGFKIFMNIWMGDLLWIFGVYGMLLF